MNDDSSQQSAEARILEKYRDVGWQPGGELLLHQSDALRFILDCRTFGLTILGMDFYTQINGGLMQVNSVDWSHILSMPDAVERTAAESYRLIKDGLLDGATWVSFVVAKQRR